MNITIQKAQFSERQVPSSRPRLVYMIHVAHYKLQSHQYLDFAQKDNRSK